MEKSFIFRMLHWGPLLALFLIATITISTTYCHLQWWPIDGVLALANLLLFLMFSSQCTLNLFKAAHVGPGFVPFHWNPPHKDDTNRLQFCCLCRGYKAPRSHHCRKCNRCVLKMDHHCPWINNCCGFKNQAYFIKFLLFAVLGCLHATLILGPSIHRSIFRVWYIYFGTGFEPLVDLGVFGLFGAIFAVGMAVGVILAVGFLLAVQIRSVLRNKSGIDDYILSKAMSREREDVFVFPYDLGWKRNFRQVFYPEAPYNDGIIWPVVDGCDQFTFTEEQLKQKELKRQIQEPYIVVEPYNGSMFCTFWQFGCIVHFCQPLGEDARLELKVGQQVLVSRWRRHWLYGESSAPDNRGWFPRRCVRQLAESGDEDDDVEKDELASNYSRDEKHMKTS